MKIFYVRHGEPTYDPDELTPQGVIQANALSNRLSKIDFDVIYSSTSNRAYQTGEPTAQKLNKEIIQLDFANEKYAWKYFRVKNEEDKYNWACAVDWTRELFASAEIRDMGDKWYEHPAFKDTNFERGIKHIYDEVDKFMLSLGYEHLRYTGKYKVVSKTPKNIALFAHAGFGEAFLSCLLDIPYPQLCTHFDMCHTGMSVISFSEKNGISIPCIKMFSADSHLYHENVKCVGIDY